MTQPFDNRDWDLRQIAERDAQIERLKNKISGLEKLNQMTDEAVVMELKAQIERLKLLTTRAADALEEESWPSLHHDYSKLIDELRKAAE
jgi:hypothetical protein